MHIHRYADRLAFLDFRKELIFFFCIKLRRANYVFDSRIQCRSLFLAQHRMLDEIYLKGVDFMHLILLHFSGLKK